MDANTTATADESKVTFGVDYSRGFIPWLIEQKISLALTTYQVGKIIFFGVDTLGKFWSYNRNIGRCLGMTFDEHGFWVTSATQFYRFDNILPKGAQGEKGADALYAPRFSYFTGDLDIHDLGIDENDNPIFVNTLFNCLARPSRKHSFEVVWKPSFITKLAAEDRCHLNGLAMVDKKPKYVTAVSATDTFDSWRDGRRDGGVVIDVTTNEIICSGLSMPHSPRWHAGKLWLHNSGKGEFGYVDLKTGKFEPIVFCPGYLRGLDFINGHAVVGMSLPRENKTFAGLDLEDELQKRNISPRRGLYFINLQSGDIVHSLTFQGVVTELYDVAVIKDVRQPSALGPNSEGIKRTLSLPTIA